LIVSRQQWNVVEVVSPEGQEAESLKHSRFPKREKRRHGVSRLAVDKMARIDLIERSWDQEMQRNL